MYLIVLFLVLDLVLALVYFFSQRPYPFLKACPVKRPFCLGGKTLKFPRSTAVGFTLKPGEPFYAVADGVLTYVAVGSGKRRARGYKLYLKNGINIFYTFPWDAQFLPDETPPNRLSPTVEEFLGRRVKAGQVIGHMGKQRLPGKAYRGANLVISMVDVGQPFQYPPEEAERKPYKFLPLKAWDLWFR